MLLRQENLDDQTYAAIAERARAGIADYTADWTDHNAHDPGIMLLELFAWLKEMQQFYLDQMEEADAMLPLLGVACQPSAAAEVQVQLSLEETPASPICVPHGTPLWAEDIPYETTRAVELVHPQPVSLLSPDGTDMPMPCFPFGRMPQNGSSFLLLLAAPEKGMEERRISIRLAEGNVRRNPPSADFPLQLADLAWECRTAKGFSLLAIEDNTFGLLCDGEITLFLPQTAVRDADGYLCIRCTLLSQAYDIPPQLREISTTSVTVQQRETVYEVFCSSVQGGGMPTNTYLAQTGVRQLFAEDADGYLLPVQSMGGTGPAYELSESVPSLASTVRYHLLTCRDSGAERLRFLGTAEGIAHQIFRVDTRGQQILSDSFVLWVASCSEGSRSIERARAWTRVDSLYASAPSDEHYMLNARTGEVRFGDGINGRMPRGEVMVASLALTQAGTGNIAPQQLGAIECAGHAVRVHQPDPATGGREAEFVEEAVARQRVLSKRAVTGKDIEELVQQTPALCIERVHAFAEPAAQASVFAPQLIAVVVQPSGDRTELSDVYARQIRAWLEPNRLLGTEFSLRSPRYVEVETVAEVSLHPHRGNAKEDIARRFREVFGQLCAGFGTTVRNGALLLALGSFPEVQTVSALHLQAHGSGFRRNEQGDLLLEQDVLAVLITLHLLAA